MNISRRLALGCASAFAFTGGTEQLGLASVVKSATKALSVSSYRNTQTSQRFEELLIHRDESGHAPYIAEISIAAPDTSWYGIFTLEDYKYRILNHDYKKHGYRLKRVSAFNTRDGIRYSALWEMATGPDWQSVHAMTPANFENASKDFKQRGYRMTHIDARVNYAAVWEKGDNTSQQVFSALTLTEYEQQLATLSAQGYKPAKISAAAVGGVPRIAAIFEKGSVVHWQTQHQMAAADFGRIDRTAKSQGYRLTDASGYMLNGKPNFSGIWEKA